MQAQGTGNDGGMRRPIRGTDGIYATYQDYLDSAEWQAKRAAARARYGNRCQACQCNGTGSQGRLQVHHLTYERVGRERMSDFTVLCERCHKREHDLDERDLRTVWPRRFSLDVLRKAAS